MPIDDREQPFERALARQLRESSSAQVCPDAETLAAYHGRTLPLEEMTRWKEHISGCTRCQEILALVEQTENLHAEEWEDDPAPALLATRHAAAQVRAAASRPEDEASLMAAAPAATSLTRAPARNRWRWIVPAGSLAAAVLVWVGYKETRVQHIAPSNTIQVAENKAAAPQNPADAYEASREFSRYTAISPRLDQAEPAPKTVAPVPKPALTAPAAPSKEAGDALLKQDAAADAAKRKDLEKEEATRAAPRPPSPTLQLNQNAVAGVPQAGAGAAGAVGGAVPAPKPPSAEAGKSVSQADAKKTPPAAVMESVEMQAQAPPASSQAVEVVSPPQADTAQNQSAVRARSVTDLATLTTGDSRLIFAPGGKRAWRVGIVGIIEHSTDGGKTWTPQSSGVATDLTAGSAASGRVCWVVGRNGTVLLTTDGGNSWRQLASPLSGDLGGVHATDAKHASIWDASKQNNFETNDGGATWQRTSNE